MSSSALGVASLPGRFDRRYFQPPDFLLLPGSIAKGSRKIASNLHDLHLRTQRLLASAFNGPDLSTTHPASVFGGLKTWRLNRALNTSGAFGKENLPHFHENTCTSTLARAHLHEKTCTSTLARAHLHEKTCTSTLARENLHEHSSLARETCAQAHLHENTCTRNLHEHTCTTKLARENLHEHTCTSTHVNELKLARARLHERCKNETCSTLFVLADAPAEVVLR